VSEADRRRPEHSIAIAGGGIIGMSIAWRLARGGWAVTVYERAALGHEASWAGAGMLSPGGEIDTASPLAPLAIESRRLYPAFVRELEETLGSPIDYQECGGLDLAYSPAELDALKDRAKRQSDLGIASKPVAAGQVSTFWPRVRTDKLAGARFYPGDAIVNPRDVMSALAAACRARAVSVVESCSVCRARISPNEVAVETAHGAQNHSALVIAAGAWSNSISVSGTDPLPPVEPAKGHLIGYQQPQQTCNTIVRHGHIYILQRANGLMIAGSSVERVGFDRDIQPEIIHSLAERAGFLFPHLRDTTPSEGWIGFRPASETLHMGMWGSPRLYLAYGHYRNGILLAPVTAERVSAAINANLGMR